MSQPLLPIIVVSGGAETVSASIIEWAVRQGRRVLVYALASPSLVEGLEGCEVTYAPSRGRRDVLKHFADWVESFAREASSLVAFPTEDDSLGLLVDALQCLDGALMLSRCRALASGGLSKAEVFAFLERRGLQRYIAETRVIMSEYDLLRAADHLGDEMILKPAVKPWGRNLAGGAKVFHDLNEPGADAELRSDWSAGRPWLAQRRLRPLKGGERSACVVRTAEGQIRYAEVLEREKYPSRGGSACWVETQPDSTLLREAAVAIVEALDAVGVVELSFLADDVGNPRLLELNARPWLQVELLLLAGFDVLSDAELAVAGHPIQHEVVAVDSRSWISMERMLLKLIRGDGAGRRHTISQLRLALQGSPHVSVWSSSLPGLRSRWMYRSIRHSISAGIKAWRCRRPLRRPIRD